MAKGEKKGRRARRQGPAKLPKNLQQQRESMVCSDRNYHTSTANSASQYMSLGSTSSSSTTPPSSRTRCLRTASGLVPLKIDPSQFEFKTAEEAPSEKNTVVLRLDVACKREDGRAVNSEVYSSALEWLPAGSEFPEETSCRFASGQGMAPSAGGALAPWTTTSCLPSCRRG
eukprot:jgi/Tetstr1/447712/TSEL_000015.t1